VTTSSTTRAFLLGRVRVRTPIRPPWASPEARFLDTCERCGDCLRVCETRVIRIGAGGYPEVSFEQAGCTLCGDCAVVCKGRALSTDPASVRPWGHRVRISEGCLSRLGVVCRSCGEACDERAIRFRPKVGGSALPSLEGALCTGCGQCLGRCPVNAIQIDHEPLPAAETEPRIQPSEHL
jgi:ferredoxin-type protein NapF